MSTRGDHRGGAIWPLGDSPDLGESPRPIWDSISVSCQDVDATSQCIASYHADSPTSFAGVIERNSGVSTCSS